MCWFVGLTRASLLIPTCVGLAPTCKLTDAACTMASLPAASAPSSLATDSKAAVSTSQTHSDSAARNMTRPNLGFDVARVPELYFLPRAGVVGSYGKPLFPCLCWFSVCSLSSRFLFVVFFFVPSDVCLGRLLSLFHSDLLSLWFSSLPYFYRRR